LFGITIRQGTKPNFLSVSDLQKAYETARWQHGWSSKDHNTIMRTQDFLDRVYYLLFERGLVKTSKDGFMGMIKDEGITNTLKGLGVWKTTGKGATKTVMADPYIWILV
jgi:hypothetical protein